VSEADPGHIADIVQILTFSPLTYGQLCMLKTLWDRHPDFVSGSELEQLIYDTDGSAGQLRGMMSTFGKRNRRAGATTPGAAKANNRFMLEDRHDGSGRLSYRLRPETRAAIDYVPELKERLETDSYQDFKAGEAQKFSASPDAPPQRQPEVAPSQRRYWAGGHTYGQESQLERFLEGGYWEHGFSQEDTDNRARKVWERFEQLRPGDWIAVKGYGGRDNLVVHKIGEITRLEPETRRAHVKWLDNPTLKVKGVDAGKPGDLNWYWTLVEVRNPQAVEAIFGVKVTGTNESQPPTEFPLNLILYGPPGTGKTYALQNDIARTLGLESEDCPLVTFHPSFSYEFFVEGLRPESTEDGGVNYPVQDGVFLSACQAALTAIGWEETLDAFCQLPREEREGRLENAPPVALFIDEINRGKVSRILGELITLLEPDKRLGADNELIVTLPTSKRRFGVPSNLYLIGTMNTADRSAVALDVALRRRFAFRHCPPRPELLDDYEVEGVNLGAMLRTINDRLHRLRDADHLVGHAWLWALRDGGTLADLQQVFANAILPLLQEYFFDDLGRVGLVLGPRFVRRIDGLASLANFDHPSREDLEEITVFELVDIEQLTAEDFRSIYAD